MVKVINTMSISPQEKNKILKTTGCWDLPVEFLISASAGLNGSLRICVSNKLPSNVDIAGLKTMF